ncbi:hypothetical protein [Streptosporangium subroseum]|uniref:hypothetical protein n=1 Tax=Streptosporangium subroseum TaxID=106412 RepID=UPI00308B4FD6|nr:hypothetical protein OHB15_37635 [Streptosporangium subroseum]
MTGDTQVSIDCLEKLAAELEQRRFTVLLHTTAGRPASLSVTNTVAPALTRAGPDRT